MEKSSAKIFTKCIKLILFIKDQLRHLKKGKADTEY